MHSTGLWRGGYYGDRAGSKISFDVSVLPCGLEEAKEGVPEYMTFGERNGFESHREQQLLGINIRLRNRLYNWFAGVINRMSNTEDMLSFIVDKLGEISISNEHNKKVLVTRFFQQAPQSKWYDPYTIIELLIEFQRKNFGCLKCSLPHCPDIHCVGSSLFIKVIEKINSILDEENSGYRLIDDVFVPITNSVEIDEVVAASSVPYEAVRKLIDKAIKNFSDKANPDYENTIKDAISAVESMCCIITGMTGSSATLGAALKKLGDNGVVIHGALREDFSKMYGYTSDEDGIRHGGIDFKHAPIEDARYMLVTCSAFVNYLISKYDKSKVECVRTI